MFGFFTRSSGRSVGRFEFGPSSRLTPDTRAIGANGLLAFLEAAESMGYPPELVLEGLRYRPEELRARRARVSWRDLIRTMENVERAGASLADFERAGERIAHSPHLALRPIVDFFIRPEHLFYVGLRWIGPATFPVFNVELDYRGRELRLSLALPDALPESPAYFHICKGTLSAIPTAIGQPKARVHCEITPRKASFDIQCAPFDRGAVRLNRIARALLSVPRVVETLVEQEDAIRHGLDAALDSQSQFMGFLGALPDAVVIIRQDRIVYANPALARALGYERASELIGTSWSLFDQGAASECRFVRRDGKVAILELSPRRTIEYEGAAAELIVARDVTEKKELQSRVALADRMASLATVAAGIAHEINNPLALVISNLDLAQRQPESSRDFLRAAAEGAERVRNIVAELRVFSQPESETAVPVDLREVVESSVALARGKVNTRATLSVELEAVGPVLGARGKLSQVLLNLIINALEALPRERPIRENQIRVRLFARDGKACVEVVDNGMGIPEAAQPHVFEPFFSARIGGGGSGLGLAVAHDILSRYRGSIRFRSTPGSGTTFSIELPLYQDEKAVADSHARALAQAPSLRILIADDEPSLLRTLELALSQQRYSVVSALSGREAIDRIERDGDFDLILCDLMMPNGSGADVYAHVRATRPDLCGRIVFMTGGAFGGEAKEFLASVGNPCLDKPFRLDELNRLASKAVARRRGIA